MRPLISEVDIDELVYSNQAIVNESDYLLEQLKDSIKDSPSLANSQRQLRCVGFCMHLYYGLESTVEVADPAAYYGLPTNELFAHYTRIAQAQVNGFLEVLESTIAKVIPMLEEEWISSESKASLSGEQKEAIGKVRNLCRELTQSLQSLPISLLNEGVGSAARPGEQKKPVNFTL